jgi:hypothetical protein
MWRIQRNLLIFWPNADKPSQRADDEPTRMNPPRTARQELKLEGLKVLKTDLRPKAFVPIGRRWVVLTTARDFKVVIVRKRQAFAGAFFRLDQLSDCRVWAVAVADPSKIGLNFASPD